MHEATIKSIGKISYQEKPFDEAYKSIITRSGKLITARDLAYARSEKGKNSHLSTNGSYVREGSLFVPKSEHKRYWVRNSLILKNVTGAVEQHRKSEEYFLKDDFQVEKFLKNLPKDAYLILDDLSPIPTNLFGNSARAKWLFGDMTEKYGEFLQEAGLSQINIFMHNDSNYIDHKNRVFANQLWVRRVGDDSDIDGDGSLNDSSAVRWVFPLESVEGAKKIRTYTPAQAINCIRESCKNIGIEGEIQKILIADLEARLK